MDILFLDIDGVMHGVDSVKIEYTPSGITYVGKNQFQHLPLLGDILNRCPDVSVVISSSWRHIYSLEDLQGFFGAWGGRVIGTTHSVDVRDSLPANRFQECRAVAELLGAARWLMVDDQPSIVWGSQVPSPELLRKVVHCDSVLGLASPLVVEEIVKRFS